MCRTDLGPTTNSSRKAALLANPLGSSAPLDNGMRFRGRRLKSGNGSNQGPSNEITRAKVTRHPRRDALPDSATHYQADPQNLMRPVRNDGIETAIAEVPTCRSTV
jgi:hypothetical protein